MPAFQPAAQYSFSADGLTASLVDGSNYSDNNESVTLANIGQRQAAITDGKGNLVTTVVFPANELTVTFAVTKDYYLATVLNFTLADSTVRHGQVNYLSTRIFDGTQRLMASRLDCGCNSGRLCNNLVKASECRDAALTATLFGQPSDAQGLIDAANTLINSVQNC